MAVVKAMRYLMMSKTSDSTPDEQLYAEILGL